ncbi:unnamed protein product [Ophioblennius macclurei]
MRITAQIAFLLFWMAQDFMRCNTETNMEVLTVNLNQPFTLNCTYNCSTEFVRGCWDGHKIKNFCHVGTSDESGSCTVSLPLPKVSKKNLNIYICYTERTDDPQLPRQNQRTFILTLPAQTSTPNLTRFLTTESANDSHPVQLNETAEGESIGIQVLATVSVFVAMILAALAVYLCVNRQHWTCKEESSSFRSGSSQQQEVVFMPLKGTPSAQSERVTLRLPPPNNEDDTEVPYADIMITVRGVSTPELTQVNYSASGDQREWWGDDSRAHLHAARSADRLHVPQPREVSRKMSTNSEYAIITYA